MISNSRYQSNNHYFVKLFTLFYGDTVILFDRKLSYSESKIMKDLYNLGVNALGIGLATAATMIAQANVAIAQQSTFVFPSGGEFLPVEFDDGGFIVPGSSWITVEEDFDVSIINWNIVTTDGFTLPGTLYTPENSVLGDLFEAEIFGDFLEFEATFSQFEPLPRELLLSSFFGFAEETEFNGEFTRFGDFFSPLVLSSQFEPILPNPGNIVDGVFIFTEVPSLAWSDPFLASAYSYTMDTPGSLFTEIADFPIGFDNPFTVSVGDTILGNFEPGDNLIFPDGGVTSFTISGITPPGLSDDPTAFPIQLGFNTPTASFTQKALLVPEPGIILGLGIVSLGAFLDRKLKRK